MLAEALNRQNPTGRLHSEAVGFKVLVGRESKTKIVDKIPCAKEYLDAGGID
jgi:hypothetical protein